MQYAYTSVAIGDISSALAAAFTKIKDSGTVELRRSASTNLILPLSEQADLAQIDQLAYEISAMHPARVFVLHRVRGLSQITAEISTHCHMLSSSEGVCSEIIRLSAGFDLFDALPAIVRAHLLTGMSCDAYLPDPKVDPDLLGVLTSLFDTVMFDSSLFSGRLEVVTELMRLGVPLVDLQWVGMSPWRDQMKNLFDQPALRELLPTLRKIDIVSSSRSPETGLFCSALFSGWLLDRLGLRVGVVPKGRILEVSNDRGMRFSLAQEVLSDESVLGQLREVVLLFAPQKGLSPSVKLLRDQNSATLETLVDVGQVYRRSRPLDADTTGSRLRRHFLVGESFANYSAALQNALRICGR